MKKTNNVFLNKNAENNFKFHVSLANPLVTFVIKTGYYLLIFMGKGLERVPGLRLFYRPTMSLISMHNLAAKNGLNLSSEVIFGKRKVNDCLFLHSDEQIKDLVIIGSGPGGAMAARDAKSRFGFPNS